MEPNIVPLLIVSICSYPCLLLAHWASQVVQGRGTRKAHPFMHPLIIRNVLQWQHHLGHQEISFAINALYPTFYLPQVLGTENDLYIGFRITGVLSLNKWCYSQKSERSHHIYTFQVPHFCSIKLSDSIISLANLIKQWTQQRGMGVCITLYKKNHTFYKQL